MLHAAPSRSRRASAPHRVSATSLLSQVEARAADCDVTAYVQPSSAEAFSETPTAFGHLIVLSHKCPVAFVLVQTVGGAEKLLLPFNPTFAESVGERSLMVEERVVLCRAAPSGPWPADD